MAVIQLTSPLILAGDPTLPLHPVTKQYADNKLSHLDASGFSDGILSPARLPAFIGDVTKAAGSNSISLTPTGVTPGTYTRVTINSSGRIISGGAWTSSNMPAISWSKIVTGKPNTLAGYGITNAITSAGGTITGPLNLTATPSNNYHLVNKGYVDGVITSGSDGLFTGDVVRMANKNTPLGFLRCNGGKVSKTTYISLYAVIGDKFQVILNNDTAKPWLNQAGIKLSGVPAPMVKTYTLPPVSGWPHVVVGYANHYSTAVIKNRLYLLSRYGTGGGYSESGVHSFEINSNNELINPRIDGTFSGSFPGNVGDLFAIKNKLYFSAASVVNSQDNNLRQMTINSDGTVTTPIVVFSDPGKLMAGSKFVLIKNRVYVFDYFFSNNPLMEYGYFEVNSDGNLTSLTSLGTISPDLNRSGIQSPLSSYYLTGIIAAFTVENKLILLANDSMSNASIYYASINSDSSLSSWTKGISFSPGIAVQRPEGSSYGPGVVSKPFVTANGLFILYHTGAVQNDGAVTKWEFKFYKLSWDSNGIPISWSLGQAFNHVPRSTNHFPVIVKNRVYLNPIIPSAFSATPYDYVDINGGLNDYTPYYDGSLSETDPLNFFLPDFTSKETAGTKYFIKT